MVYTSLCYVLSDRQDQVNWSVYSDADWSLLPRMAQTEGVAPLIHWKLKETSDLPSVPPAVRTALADSFYSNVVSNTLLFRELDRILAALTEANIPVIVLKGAALAQTLYPDPAASSVNSGQRLRLEYALRRDKMTTRWVRDAF